MFEVYNIKNGVCLFKGNKNECFNYIDYYVNYINPDDDLDIRKMKDNVSYYNVVAKLDKFLKDHDPYEYNDTSWDFNMTKKMINNDPYDIIMHLLNIIEEIE